MASALVNNMLDNLEEEDYKAAISFIEYLSSARKKKRAEESEKILSEIQHIFEADMVYSLYRRLDIHFCESTEQSAVELRDKKDIPILSDAL